MEDILSNCVAGRPIHAMSNRDKTWVYDAVVCVGPKKLDTSKLAIRSLQLFARPRRIYTIASSRFFAELRSLNENGCDIILIDEDAFIEAVSLHDLEKYLMQRTGSTWGTGWYLQQFLKMAAARLPDIARHYLIWDSDTVMLRAVEFFDAQGRVLVNPKEEHHRPYFELTEKLLGFGRSVPFSFISEHFMVNAGHMRELLQMIETQAPDAKNWVYAILDQITSENLKNSGFSEFETYGNFLQVHHPGSYCCRPLNSSREGAALFGMSPNKCDLYYLLKRGYCFVSFEWWNRKKGWRLWPRKLKSAVLYGLGRIAASAADSQDNETIGAILCRR
jgi:hypothetical protein